jgi:toxin-antitoxin system PIN domain toxin
MIIPDINLLIYAYDQSCEYHERARMWWEKSLSGTEVVGLPWVVCLGFLRLISSARIFASPMAVRAATKVVQSWLARPQVQIVQAGSAHADTLFRLLNELGTAANLTTDAHLAALAIEYQAVLHTTDTDFARFAGLRWRNPLTLR